VFIKNFFLFSSILIGNSTPILFANTSQISQTKKTYTPDELSNFIYNRTFCLAGNNDGSSTLTTAGTGWLFKHESDYKYDMFTNWHVSNGMEKTVAFNYATSNTNGQSIDFNYNNTSSLYFYKLTSNANWHEGSYYKQNNKELGVDVAILEVDFSSYTNNSSLKSRLDSLNEYASTHDNYLFPGVDDFNDISNGTTLYTGGYPWENSNQTVDYPSGQWWEGGDFIYEKESNFDNKKLQHGIDGNSTSDSTKISISNCYNSSSVNGSNTAMSKMGSGCSGSMIIDSNENLVGLLWGGGGDSSISIHSYENFQWDNGAHNLYNDYVDGLWISKEVSSSILLPISLIVGSLLIAGICITIVLVKKSKKNKKSQGPKVTLAGPFV